MDRSVGKPQRIALYPRASNRVPLLLLSVKERDRTQTVHCGQRPPGWIWAFGWRNTISLEQCCGKSVKVVNPQSHSHTFLLSSAAAAHWLNSNGSQRTRETRDAVQTVQHQSRVRGWRLQKWLQIFYISMCSKR